MMYTIGWILIGICYFILMRNVLVGSVLYPFAEVIVKSYDSIVPVHLRVRAARRNYYLVVLNPLWWHFLDVIPNTTQGKLLKRAWKAFRKEEKNLKRK